MSARDHPTDGFKPGSPRSSCPLCKQQNSPRHAGRRAGLVGTGLSPRVLPAGRAGDVGAGRLDAAGCAQRHLGKGGSRPGSLCAGSWHHRRGSRQEKGHFLSSLVPLRTQDSCFSEVFSTDFDELSAEAQANFTKAIGLPGTHSSVIRRFWPGCNYRSLDVAQERMQRGIIQAPAMTPGIGGTLASWLGCPGSPSMRQQLWHRDCSKGVCTRCLCPRAVPPGWVHCAYVTCLGNPATPPLYAGQTLNKDGPCPKDPAVY